MTKDTDNFDNIAFIQYLNRRMLEEAEEAITLDLPGDDELAEPKNTLQERPLSNEEKDKKLKKRNILKRRNRMYGLKNPIVWVLEKIADTELKIEKQRPSQTPHTQDSPAMDENDVALVNHFLAKIKGEEIIP